MAASAQASTRSRTVVKSVYKRIGPGGEHKVKGVQAGHMFPGQYLQNGRAGGYNGPLEGEGQPFAGLESGEACRAIVFPRGRDPRQAKRPPRIKRPSDCTGPDDSRPACCRPCRAAAGQAASERWRSWIQASRGNGISSQNAAACPHPQPKPVGMGKDHRHDQPRNPKPKGVNAQGDEKRPGLPAWRD